ncbi:amidase signature domain-containing protein [Chaetomium fimeti]|uniref:Amidase signature domain-containing protein n=1 Tax=Chaetomium fimeti TaxID=1854472 RepID=A0AAE0H946_9PEZI|nr:amidase signature domain-containing protein [Chaetomium fimeti]
MPSLLNATVTDLTRALSDGRVSSVALTAAYLARIAEANGYFHAVIETNPDAMSIAKALDDEQRTKGRRGPLHGIPILVKDIATTLDKMETTSGSTVLLGTRCSQEARLVQRLRDAGAVILGKTNMSEWGAFRTISGGGGWSARGGLTLGAFCPNMKANGSSSGSAVATALGLAAACVGSETDGSIISPASRNGVVGFKPTLGLVSSDGLVPLALKQDVPGPITRTVVDTAYMLDALAEEHPSREGVSYVSALSGTDLSGLRIGVPSSSLLQPSDAPMEAFHEALRLLESSGATVVHAANYAGSDEFNNMSKERQLLILAGSFQTDIKQYLGNLKTNPHALKNLGDIIRLTKQDTREEYPERGIDLFELAYSVDMAGADFQAALKQNEYFAVDGGIPGTLKANRLDLIVAPAMYGPTVSFAARAGVPVVVVPLGKYPEGTDVKYFKSEPDTLVDVAPGISFGITFTGNRYSERTLLRAAYAFEQLTNVRDTLEIYNPPKADLSDFGLMWDPLRGSEV